MEDQNKANTEEVLEAAKEFMEENKELMQNLAEPEQTAKELLTEVTSLAQEEARTGQKVELPNPEEMVARLSASFVQNLSNLAFIFPKLSSREKNRVMLAILDLPTDKVPVKLKSNEEVLAFKLGQEVLMARFGITMHYVNEQRKLAEAKKETPASEVAPEETSNV